MKSIPVFFAALLLLAGCSVEVENVIIPRPVQVEALEGWSSPDAPVSVEIVSDFCHGEEGYVLEILPSLIRISAGSDAGVFYAQQSLEQLRSSGRRIHAQRITDYPRFEYRGVHLDVSRHFRDKEFVKKQLEVFASLKLNRFHFIWWTAPAGGYR